VGVLGLTGCVDGREAPASTDARIAEVRALREDLAGPAIDLGRAGARVAAAVRTLRVEPLADPETRLATVAAARADAVAQLEEALDAAEQVVIEGDGPDARAATATWQEVLGVAEQLREGADRELELVGRLATADAELDELRRVWDEPGSRRQQLETLAAAAERADALAAELRTQLDAEPCTEDLQRRIDAATFVASATRELRDHVSRQRGNAFDARRAELAEDPYGLGAPLTTIGDRTCWEEHSPVPMSATGLTDALESLEAALNPPDLATPARG
jgi:hypothetical protein